MTSFSSEGFDLDAVADASKGDVVFELGGGVTVLPKAETPATSEPPTPDIAADTNPLFEAEEFKAKGNDEFKKGAYLDAYDWYTNAIDACPDSISAEEILRRRDAFQEKERQKAVVRHRIAEETRRRRERDEPDKDASAAAPAAAAATEPTPTSADMEATKPEEFKLDPLPPHAETLAIYYCNRAACLLQLGRFEEALTDCDVSALLCPSYVKAYVRRSTAYEKTDRIEEALRDAKTAFGMEPTNVTLRQRVAYLQKKEDERLEKLKAETFDKLKELGNSLLGNFGLSLDNFKAVQDPNTGSYSISFEQQK